MTWLEDVEHIPCPQHSSRLGIEPDTITIHYSVGGGSAAQMMRYFANRPQHEASYHLGFGRKGGVAQGVPLDRASWHAKGVEVGAPRYRPGRNNRRTIGVCFANWGFAVDPHRYPAVQATHETHDRSRLWEPYTDAAIASFRRVLPQILEAYPSVRYVCGHEDHTYGKSDPGPVFPWAAALGGTGLIRAWNTWPDGRGGDAEWQYMPMRGDG